MTSGWQVINFRKLFLKNSDFLKNKIIEIKNLNLTTLGNKYLLDLVGLSGDSPGLPLQAN